MNFGKVPGKDGISAELYKALGKGPLRALHAVLTSIWEEEDMPPEFHDTTIVALYKSVRVDCSNYRRISLLTIGGKILVCIILNRLPTICLSHSVVSAQIAAPLT